MDKHYNTLNDFYRNKFGQKVVKISIDAGLTCPNRDGKKGLGGCIFCSKAPYIGDKDDNLINQISKIKSLISNKARNAKYIIYLEAGTNTYASVEKLKSIYEPLLEMKDVVGLNIGTRCDCLEEDVLNYLKALSKRTYLTIELGLQSCHNETLKFLNRNHTQEEFTNAVKKLHDIGIDVIVHIINGLPNETEKMMIDTAKYVNSLNVSGIKIHMLYIERDTPLFSYYQKNQFHILSKEEYFHITAKQLQLLNNNIIIHRIISNPDIKKLYKPEWLVGKFTLLNDIDKYLSSNSIFQGQFCDIMNKSNE